MTHPYTIEEAEDHIGDLRGKTDILSEAHTKNDVTDPPNNPPAGLISYSAAGHEKYASGDGNDYNTGRATYVCSAALTLSASMQTVAGLSAPLAIGNYRAHAQILFNPATGTGIPTYQYSGSGGLVLSHGRLTICEVFQLANTMADWGGDGVLPFALAGPAVGTSFFDRIVTFDGYLVVSTGGTLNIQAKLSSGTGSIQQYGSYLEVMPVT